jgi:DNA-binding NtrC family response regulator
LRAQWKRQRPGRSTSWKSPFDFEEIQPLVEKALERRELVAETTNMRRQLSTRSEYFNIIGASKAMQTIYETNRVSR